MAMLGELQISKGCFSIKGKIGYIPQIPWIFSGSVKQNIIFGQALEEERYRKVLKACALEQVNFCFAPLVNASNCGFGNTIESV